MNNYSRGGEVYAIRLTTEPEKHIGEDLRALKEPSEYVKVLLADLEDAKKRGDMKEVSEIRFKLQSHYI